MTTLTPPTPPPSGPRVAENREQLHIELEKIARPHRELLGRLLLGQGKLREQQLNDALAQQQQERGKRLGEILVKSGAVSQEDVYRALSYQLDMPLARLGTFDIDADVVQLVSQDLVRKHNCMPLMLFEDRMVVAMDDPSNVHAIDQFGFATSRMIEPVLATPDDVELAIATHYAPFDDKQLVAQIEQMTIGTVGTDMDPRRAEQLAKERPTVRLVNNIILDAIHRRASDIHIRPRENSVDLLFRIDGAMLQVRSFSRALLPAIVSRIKIIAGLDISERRLPQDGRSQVTRRGRLIDLRVSIIPAITGESVVIRILDTQSGLRSLEELGFSEHDHERLSMLLAHNHGILLVTGPTGSGKSTTLYAALQQLRRRPINIITVEDPVEYRLDGVRQIQVNQATNYTFARALRHILRHDPDVIMIGEIRDAETARIAVESALTGHLVLSTLHTNSAAATVTRLLEIGIEPYLVNSVLLGVLAQRLVRRNCPNCRVEETVDPAVRRELEVSSEEKFFRGKGCEHCNGTGCHGRVAVYELLEVTPPLRDLIRANVLTSQLERAAVEDGMTPLTENALALARAGEIPLAEAFRVRLE
jgi:type IV pilus assembly protein PilB